MNSILIFLTTVISSSLAAAAISFSFTEAKERWLLRRSKIEEIYLSSATWLKDVGISFLPLTRVCDGSLTYNQMLDLQIKNANSATGSQKLKMQMNISMYEPSLLRQLQQIDTALGKLNRIKFGIEECYERTGQAAEFLRPLNEALVAFESAGEMLLSATVRLGAIVGAERGQAAKAYDHLALAAQVIVQKLRGKQNPP